MKNLFSKPYFRFTKADKKGREIFFVVLFNSGRLDFIFSLYFWDFNFIISRKDYMVKGEKVIGGKVYTVYSKNLKYRGSKINVISVPFFNGKFYSCF